MRRAYPPGVSMTYGAVIVIAPAPSSDDARRGVSPRANRDVEKMLFHPPKPSVTRIALPGSANQSPPSIRNLYVNVPERSGATLASQRPAST